MVVLVHDGTRPLYGRWHMQTVWGAMTARQIHLHIGLLCLHPGLSSVRGHAPLPVSSVLLSLSLFLRHWLRHGGEACSPVRLLVARRGMMPFSPTQALQVGHQGQATGVREHVSEWACSRSHRHRPTPAPRRPRHSDSEWLRRDRQRGAMPLLRQLLVPAHSAGLTSGNSSPAIV